MYWLIILYWPRRRTLCIERFLVSDRAVTGVLLRFSPASGGWCTD
ncbi:hypothetical protein [Thermoleptolyngbya sp.]